MPYWQGSVEKQKSAFRDGGMCCVGIYREYVCFINLIAQKIRIHGVPTTFSEDHIKSPNQSAIIAKLAEKSSIFDQFLDRERCRFEACDLFLGRLRVRVVFVL
jgi:hypothetical protein